MVCTDDLLGMLTDIEKQLNDLEENISARINEEKSALIKERQMKVLKAEKAYTKSEARLIVKMHLQGDTSREKGRQINNLELSYKTT